MSASDSHSGDGLEDAAGKRRDERHDVDAPQVPPTVGPGENPHEAEGHGRRRGAPPPPTLARNQDERDGEEPLSVVAPTIRPPSSRRWAGPDPAGSDAERYEEQDEIARGGMGAVLRMTDLDLGREVAMKVILDEDDPDLVERFRQEARITGQLEHPNIVPVHELGVRGDGRAYFTMKLVKGESLQAILDRISDRDPETLEAYPLSRRLRIFLCVVDAVAFAHSLGVVHRDLKPENVMVGNFGEVQVMDWGLAKILGGPDRPDAGTGRTDAPDPGREGEGSVPAPGFANPADRDGRGTYLPDHPPERTLAGTVMGTPAYMPPEQAAGRVDEIDERSDVFALGALLHAVLVLDPPYTKDSVASQLEQAVTCRIPPLRKRYPSRDVPAELESVCLKAMQAKPAKRYRTAALLGEDVQAFLERRLVKAHAYGFWARGVRFVQRHPVASMAAGVAALMLVISGAVLSVVLSQRRAAELRAEAEEAQRVAAEKDARFEKWKAAEAERQKKDAEDRARKAEASLKKGRLVSGLLRSAHVELGGVVASLKVLRWTPMEEEARQRKRRDLMERLLLFERDVPPDSASRATWDAMRGWFAWVEGRRTEAEELFRTARERDPEVVYGWLFEAMGWFGTFMRLERFPAYQLGRDEVWWSTKPQESEDQGLCREKFEALVSEVREAQIWGESSARDFLEALEAMKAYHRADFAGSIRMMGRALAIPEMAWIADELYFARAKTKLLVRDFEGALLDLDRTLSFASMGSSPYLYKAQTHMVRGYVERFAGRDPDPDWKAAVALYDEVERRYPGREYYNHPRGMIRLTLADRLAAQGGDPEPLYRSAIADFTAGSRLAPGAHARDYNTAVALFSLARARRSLGQWLDARGRDGGPEILEALADILHGVGIYPSFPEWRGKLLEEMEPCARHLSLRGKSPAAHFEEILASRKEAAGNDAQDPGPLLEIAAVLECLRREGEAVVWVRRALDLMGDRHGLTARVRSLEEAARVPPWKALADRALLMVDLGDFAAALCLFETALAEGARSGALEAASARGIHVSSALLHSQASAGRVFLKPPGEPPEPAVAAKHRAAALDHLKIALAIHRNDVPGLLDLKDFDSIRDLPEFEALYGE